MVRPRRKRELLTHLPLFFVWEGRGPTFTFQVITDMPGWKIRSTVAFLPAEFVRLGLLQKDASDVIRGVRPAAKSLSMTPLKWVDRSGTQPVFRAATPAVADIVPKSGDEVAILGCLVDVFHCFA